LRRFSVEDILLTSSCLGITPLLVALDYNGKCVRSGGS
jgi:hypothetical protein